MSERILCGDALEQLRTIESESVHVCVTSPPYYNLRDYGAMGQIGMESSPEEYIARLVCVFREVRRVLRSDGTLWVNIGDSYRGKNLTGIPWMLAFALRSDGWYLRQDIIWNKTRCIPESVRDRCTRSHEYIFLLSKSGRYYFNGAAIREPVAESTITRMKQDIAHQKGFSPAGKNKWSPKAGRQWEKQKQTKRVEPMHSVFQRRSFRRIPGKIGGAVHIGRMPGGWNGAGPLCGKWHHGCCCQTAGPEFHRR